MYVVALHLTGEPASYQALNDALQKLGDWSNRLPGAWLVQSNRSARELRDALKPHVQANDRLFVAQFSRNWAATNMGPGFAEWIGRRTFDAPATTPALPTIVTPLSFANPPAVDLGKRKPKPGVKPPRG
jgi:hypothetical protein